MTKKKAHWLLKTEPETYSFEMLESEGKTHWTGVRNFQARNFLKEMTEGDLALIYHSGKEKSVVGIAEVTRSAFPEVDSDHPGDWVQVDLVPLEKLASPVSLAEIKTIPELSTLKLLKQSRLSVMPVDAEHFRILLKLGKTSGRSKK